MATLKIAPEAADVQKLYEEMGHRPEKFKAAFVDTLNKSMAHGRVIAAQDVADNMGASKKSVNNRFTLYKATKSNLSAAIYIKGGKGIDLASFGARQNQSGASAKVFGVRTTYKHTYIAKVNGKKHVFLNVGEKVVPKAGRYKGMSVNMGTRNAPNFQPILRKPMIIQKGPSVAETFATVSGIADHANTEIRSSMAKNFASRAAYFLKKD